MKEFSTYKEIIQAMEDDYEHLKQKHKAAQDVVRWGRAVLSSDERGRGVTFPEAMTGMHHAILAYDKNVKYWDAAIPVRAMKKLGWDQAMREDGMYQWVKYDSDSGACRAVQGDPVWFEDLEKTAGK